MEISFESYTAAPPQYSWTGCYGVHAGGMDDPNGWIEFSVTHLGGKYRLRMQYAAGDSRPCQMSVGGNVVADNIAAEVTGGFDPGHIAWKDAGEVDLGAAGTVTVGFKSKSFMPHLAAFSLTPAGGQASCGAQSDRENLKRKLSETAGVYVPLPPLPTGESCGEHGVLGVGIDYENMPPHDPAYDSHTDSMFNGHLAGYCLNFDALESTWLGFTQFTRVMNLFERPIGDQQGHLAQAGIHFGLTGQWIQDRAGNAAGPWGSIEGGLFASRKLGKSSLPKYHVAASSHRYDMYSDTAGGWGFYEVSRLVHQLARAPQSH